MAQQSRTTLKTYFNTGDIPTEAQFANLIDSSVPVQTTADASGGTVSPDFTETTSIYILAEVGDVIIGAPAGIMNGQKYTFVLEQGGIGGNNVTFHSAYVWPTGFVFNMPTNLGERAIVEAHCTRDTLFLKEATYYS